MCLGSTRTITDFSGLSHLERQVLPVCGSSLPSSGKMIELQVPSNTRTSEGNCKEKKCSYNTTWMCSKLLKSQKLQFIKFCMVSYLFPTLNLILVGFVNISAENFTYDGICNVKNTRDILVIILNVYFFVSKNINLMATHLLLVCIKLQTFKIWVFNQQCSKQQGILFLGVGDVGFFVCFV